MDPGDGSMDGWSWTLQGRVTNTETITQQINYAARQPRAVLRVRGHQPQRAGQLRRRSRSATPSPAPPGPRTTRRPRRALPGRHGQPAGRHRQPRLHRRAVRRSRAATSSPRCCRPGGRCATTASWSTTSAASARSPRRSAIRSRPASCRSAPLEPSLAPLHGRLLPRLRPELPGSVALQRVEARVRPVRRQRRPAEPLAGALEPRPHGQLRDARSAA